MLKKAKILAPLIAVIYIVVCGSSMLCASASIYFTGKGPKRLSSAPVSQGKEPVVWIINRHIVTPVKENVSSHLTIENPPLPVQNEFYIITTSQPEDLFQSEYFSAGQGRAPPVQN